MENSTLGVRLVSNQTNKQMFKMSLMTIDGGQFTIKIMGDDIVDALNNYSKESGVPLSTLEGMLITLSSPVAKREIERIASDLSERDSKEYDSTSPF